MQYTNIHTHTTFSDGKNTPEEMIKKAIELGFASIGISDHSETAFDSAYCMAAADYADYKSVVGDLKKKYGDRINVFCGIERDSYSSAACEGFDYVIGSVHYILYRGEHLSVDFSLEKQTDAIQRCFGGDKMEYARRYYDILAENVLRGGFEVLGHFDLLNKFGLFSDCSETYQKIAFEALDTALSAVPYLEMNTGAIARGYNAVYPADVFLRRIYEKGGKIVLNGDSHSAEALDCHFDQALDALKKAGFSSVWQLRGKGWTEIPIS
ncbi:MAG: histidinol-phosphatase HisJ family protein [Ruminococcaceae bacterium]|nr:histidinol-phosphatase HisJ family protein [Oscillospiraceae bacterium]